MTNKDHYLRFSRFQQSREKAYGPLINNALEKQVHQYISTGKLDRISSAPVHEVLIHIYKDAALNYGKITRRNIKKSIGINEHLIELINQYFGTDILNASQGITETTIKMIQEILTQSTIDGLGFDDIVAKLVNTELNKARARLIARTETVTAANRGAHIAAKETGLTLNKEWLSTIDNRTREHHANMNGVVIAMDDYFNLGNGVLMLVPGDRGGTDGRLDTPANEVCNCRCTVLYLPIE